MLGILVAVQVKLLTDRSELYKAAVPRIFSSLRDAAIQRAITLVYHEEKLGE